MDFEIAIESHSKPIEKDKLLKELKCELEK